MYCICAHIHTVYVQNLYSTKYDGILLFCSAACVIPTSKLFSSLSDSHSQCSASSMASYGCSQV